MVRIIVVGVFFNVHLQIRPKIYYTLFQQFPFCLVIDMVLNIKIKQQLLIYYDIIVIL